jgi:hypothetical protein
MGDKFHAILDVTIVYPDGAPNFWQFLCGRMKRVRVRVQEPAGAAHLATGDYANDPAVREAFQQWMQQVWQTRTRRSTDCLTWPGVGDGRHPVVACMPPAG